MNRENAGAKPTAPPRLSKSAVDTLLFSAFSLSSASFDFIIITLPMALPIVLIYIFL